MGYEEIFTTILTVHTIRHFKNHVYLSLSQTLPNANLYGLETLLFFVHFFVNICLCITGRQIVNTICFTLKGATCKKD